MLRYATHRWVLTGLISIPAAVAGVIVTRAVTERPPGPAASGPELGGREPLATGASPAAASQQPLSLALWPALKRATETLARSIEPLVLETGQALSSAGPVAVPASAASEVPAAPGPRPQPVLASPSRGERPPHPSPVWLASEEPTWLALDSQLARLDNRRLGGEFGIGGFIKMTGGHYFLLDDSLDRRQSGFSLDALRLYLEGDKDDLRMYVSLSGEDPLGGGFIAKNGAAGEVAVLDAFVAFGLSEWVEIQVGSFRSPVLFSASLEENEQLFINRTYGGWLWQERDLGAMLHGDSGRLEWWLAAQNGRDQTGEEWSATGRVDLRAFGEGEARRREGAFDADLGQTLYVGAAYYHDSFSSDAQIVAGDVYYTYDRLSLSGEFTRYGSGSLDHHQWVLTGAYMLVPEKWELALRYEDFDGRSGYLTQAGVNRYLNDFRTRLQMVVGRFENLGGGDRANMFQVGLTVSL